MARILIMFKKQRVVSALDVPNFVHLLHDAVYEEEDCERVHAACDRMEASKAC